MSRLRSLDDRWLPRLARRLRRSVDRVHRAASARHGVVGLTSEAVEEAPAIVGAIAAVLIASVLIAVAGTGSVGEGASAPQPSPPSVPLAATIGPAPGASVSTYLEHAAYDLRHFGEIAGGRSTYAVVDLRRTQMPAQTVRTFDGVDVVRAYVKVPGRLPTQVRSVPIAGIDGLVAGMHTAASVATATAKSYAALLRTFHPTNHVGHVTRHRYVEAHRAALFEAARLARPQRCRCVFAAVVRADVTRLAALARLPEVRVVDPASPAIPLTGLTIRPLEPDVTTVVPTNGLLGG